MRTQEELEDIIIMLEKEATENYQIDLQVFYEHLIDYYDQEGEKFTNSQKCLFLISFLCYSQQEALNILEFTSSTIRTYSSSGLYKCLGKMFKTDVGWATVHRTVMKDRQYIISA